MPIKISELFLKASMEAANKISVEIGGDLHDVYFKPPTALARNALHVVVSDDKTTALKRTEACAKAIKNSACDKDGVLLFDDLSDQQISAFRADIFEKLLGGYIASTADDSEKK